ncbi:hypothetical protein, partial [Kribbella sp.]|uniref:WXG100-like domain-containing protein n=1 Tax=Kribbella sp. TaxID=1871183 RepID=UPI002D30EA4C
MSWWHPIVEFLGAIVGVDPDDWPKGDEDALRESARQYDAIAAGLRSTVAGGCREQSTAVLAAWNGEGGRALGAEVLAYGTDPKFGGAEAMAVAAADLAQYLRDQADTIVRTKILIFAQIVIGILMFAIPAGKLISLGLRQALRQGLKEFIHKGAQAAIKDAVRAIVAQAGKRPALAPVSVVRGLVLAGAGGVGYGLAPNTISQAYGVLTNQSGRTTKDGGHADGWDWGETRQAAEVAAVATPIAIAASVGLGSVSSFATRKVSALDGPVQQFLIRRAAGAATMGVSMPAANSIVVTHTLPTGEELWKSAVMGAAVPGGGSHGPTAGGPHGDPIEVAPVRNHSTIGGDHTPDGPPETVKPGLEATAPNASAAPTGTDATGAGTGSTQTGGTAQTGSGSAQTGNGTAQTGNGTGHNAGSTTGAEAGVAPSVGAAQPAAGARTPDASGSPAARAATDTTTPAAKTTTTSQPGKAAAPDKGAGAEKAAPPDNPPSGPDKPAVPDQPQSPGKEAPATPQDPAAANRPADADKPAGTEKPAGADKPAGTEKPAGPDNSAGADKPSGADKPGTAVEPGGAERQMVPASGQPGAKVADPANRQPGSPVRPGNHQNSTPSAPISERIAQGEATAGEAGARGDARTGDVGSRDGAPAGEPGSRGDASGGASGSRDDASTDEAGSLGGTAAGEGASRADVSAGEGTPRADSSADERTPEGSSRVGDRQGVQGKVSEAQVGPEAEGGSSAGAGRARTGEEAGREPSATAEVQKDWSQEPEHQKEVERRQAAAKAAQARYEEAQKAQHTKEVQNRAKETGRDLKDARKDLKEARKDLKDAARALRKYLDRHGDPDVRTDKPRHKPHDEARDELQEKVTAATKQYESARDVVKAAEIAAAPLRAAKQLAESERMSYLSAKLDYALARLSPEEIKQFGDGKLEVLKDALPENVTPDEALQLAMHEMIHRNDGGWGFALNVTQIQAEVALRDGSTVQMLPGEGKSPVAAVAVGMIAADRPVHFMTSNRTLAGEAYSQFRQVLEPLGYDVILVDPAVRYPKPSGRTVYVGDVAAFGWSMGRGHRVPGKDVIIDEADAVAIDRATQVYTHSSGAAGKASAKVEAEVMLAQRSLDSGKFTYADLGLTPDREPLNGVGAKLSPDGRLKLAGETGLKPTSRQFAKYVTRLESAAQAHWVLREGHDYVIGAIGGEKRILIIGQHDHDLLIDRETQLEQRWTGVGQALEARHGLEVRADPEHAKAITTRDVLDSYDRMSGMSGTMKEAEPAIRELYGEDKVGPVVEIDRFNDAKLEYRPTLQVTTIEEKYQAIVDQAIADMAKDGNLSTGRPQVIATEHNEEVVQVYELLIKRLNERNLSADAIRIEKINAERMAEWIGAEPDAGERTPDVKESNYDIQMRATLKKAGELGTITIGNKVLGRGIDIKVHPDAFTYGDRPAADVHVFTVKERGGREAITGGIAMRAGYYDPNSPRNTVQVLTRAGRQGAPGEASLVVSHQDELFRRRRSALEAAIAYHDSPSTAAHKRALEAYADAAVAHAKAVALGAGAQTAETLKAADEAVRQTEKALAIENYTTAIHAAQLASQQSNIANIRARHTAVPQSQASTTQQSDGRHPQQSDDLGTAQRVDDSARSRRVPDGPQAAGGPVYRQLAAEDQAEVRGIVAKLTANDPVRLEGLRPLLESPRLRSLDPELLMHEVRSWEGLSYQEVFSKGTLFGAGIADAPVPAPLARPSSDFADATDFGRLESLPPQLSSAGDAGRLASEDPNAGAHLMTGPDNRDWVVKLYADTAINQETAQAELEGLYGAYLTGFGPTPYGLVRVTVDNKNYIGVAMAPVAGGLIEAENRDATAENKAEAAHWRSRVTFRTAQELDLFSRALLAQGYSFRRDMRYFVDDNGNLRLIDLAGVEPLPAKGFYRDFWRERHHEVIAEARGPLVEAAVENATRQSSSTARTVAETFGWLPS